MTKERKEDASVMQRKLATQLSLAAVTGSIWRQCVTQLSACAGDSARDTHYHNKVSLAPFFHQAPVPHALISHGDGCDHTLV